MHGINGQWYRRLRSSLSIHQSMASAKLVYLFLFASFINFVTTKAQSKHGIWGSTCIISQTKPAFQSNVKTLLSYLSSNATDNKQFYNTTVVGKNHSDTVYGMFVCWGDVPPQLCSQCVANATTKLLSDPDPTFPCNISSIDPVIGYGDCMIRFSNHSFFSTADLSSPSESCRTFDNVLNQTKFKTLFSKTIHEAADEAANSPVGAKKYATKQARISGFQTLFCEAQCTPDLSPKDCRKCLNATITSAQQDCIVGLGHFDNPSCNIKYDVFPFYRPSTAPAPKTLIPVNNSSYPYSQDLSFLYQNCSLYETMTTTDKTFLSNLRTLLSSLSSNSTSKTGFYKTTVLGRNPSDTISGLFMCRGDLSPALCQQCVQNATRRISSECPSSKEALIWYNHCLLRYSHQSSLSTVDTSPMHHDFNIVNTSNPTLLQSFFTWTLVDVLDKLETETGDNTVKNYGTKSAKLNDNQTLYTLAQCTPDLSNYDCLSCLRSIFQNEIPWCCLASPEGKVLYPSCYMMFGLSQFYGDGELEASRQASPPPKRTTENKKGKSQIIIVIIVLVVVSTVLLSFCCYLRRRKAKKLSYKTLLRKNFGKDSVIIEGLQFNLTVIKAATNKFSHENKIGKGGFGEVYKVILYDGRCIAVKRLSKSSKQGPLEFKNEILLIAKLQHRNLVTFVGFCLEGGEKILIYEYLPNGSLDYHIFGTHQPKLSWSQRNKIIEGIAVGLLYLHDYSRLKIIHRDLKPSNVLLDENMNPKISDFGLAKIIEMDQDSDNTKRIAGTHGYISPEYALLGQFSEKSDIFSFGIMILEIVTGKKNVNLYESHSSVESLLSYVWRQWNDESALTILDSNIESYSQMEVLKCIHIGLLCVQENPDDRPTMATVISYLNNHSLELPSPQKPAYYWHTRRMDQDIVTLQESSSSQAVNGSKLSINEMSTSKFYPR